MDHGVLFPPVVFPAIVPPLSHNAIMIPTKLGMDNLSSSGKRKMAQNVIPMIYNSSLLTEFLVYFNGSPHMLEEYEVSLSEFVFFER